MPDQFLSDNSAVILGLDGETKLTKDMVKRAARKLYRIYHPDHFSQNEADREMAVALSKKIQRARESLEEYLEVNPTYNPQSSSSNRNQSQPQSSRPQANPYSWNDMFNDIGDTRSAYARSQNYSSSLVTEQHYGSSLRGTMFEFLYEFPEFEQAIIPFVGKSDRLESRDIIMIINPAIFPKIEIRYISKETDRDAPRLVDASFATYVRGRYQGSRDLVDGIVLPNGNFLANLVSTGKAKQNFRPTPLDPQNKKIYIQSYSDLHMTEFLQNGFSAGTSYVIFSKDATDLMPIQRTLKVPEWKKLVISVRKEVIRLSYQPEAKTCQDLFF